MPQIDLLHELVATVAVSPCAVELRHIPKPLGEQLFRHKSFASLNNATGKRDYFAKLLG